MANIYEPTKEEIAAWEEFVQSRPEKVRVVAEKFKPWKLYLNKPSNHRCVLYSFSENGENDPVTMTVDITGEYNLILHDRRVFGVKPEDLEECDLPLPGETLGSILTQKQVEENIDFLRQLIRPDLYPLVDRQPAAEYRPAADLPVDR